MPPQPQITGIDPTNAEPGTRIDIEGDDFVKRNTTVTFSNGVTGDNVFVEDTENLSVDVPEGAVTGNVVVTTPGGVSNGVGFTVDYPPVRIQRFEPTHGGSSTYVTIQGVGFNGGESVHFGQYPSTQIRWESDRRIVASVPIGARAGRVRIRVKATGGTGVSTKEFVID